MESNLKQAMQERFLQELQDMQIDPDDSDLDSEQSEDYYEYEMRKRQTDISLLRTQKENKILEELQKNTNH